MKQGRLGYNSSNDRYGLLASDLWIDTGFHCGEGLEVLVDDKWVRTRIPGRYIMWNNCNFESSGNRRIALYYRKYL